MTIKITALYYKSTKVLLMYCKTLLSIEGMSVLEREHGLYFNGLILFVRIIQNATGGQVVITDVRPSINTVTGQVDHMRYSTIVQMIASVHILYIHTHILIL